MNALLLGPIISFIVSALKKIPLVKNNPKTIALVLSVLYAGGATAYSILHSGAALDLGTLVTGILTAFGVSIGTHEVVTQSVTDAMRGTHAPPTDTSM